jgi:hypothetical protein
MQKYSLIEFYHEENDLQKKVKQLHENLDQFNVYLPHTQVVMEDS